MKPALILTSLLIVLTSLSCKHSTEPEPQPGRRDYTWTVDTINPGKESLYLYRIWGSAANDVWAVGASSWSATSIWHYNGIKWSCDSIPRRINPSALFGTSKNDVWLGNTNSTIWRYYGQWGLYGEYRVNNFDNIVIVDFDGISPNNIYGVGFKDIRNGADTAKGIIMHFNGYKWDFVNIADIVIHFESVAVDKKNGVVVLSGTVYDRKGFYAKVYSWDGKELRELLSDKGDDTYVIKFGDEIFVKSQSKIYKYSNDQLSLWKDNIGIGINGYLLCGKSHNDFFIGVSSIGINHYNGTDFNILYKIESGHRVQILNGVIFEKDVFFIANDFTIGKNLIIHGKLK
ncbi:hypothetical protein [Stygiobacter electus]|jgi:hypothetical protein|uniref:Uncharacterized protein n=1 Tax=Stygiobacter electus TaxID=3032292 RepID=A0AAE3P077_9BACT|nr:hypothetical protein [Stygiobacter electus]MDF1611679.1 hypothetical protein [Stygiobacter electus]